MKKLPNRVDVLRMMKPGEQIAIASEQRRNWRKSADRLGLRITYREAIEDGYHIMSLAEPNETDLFTALDELEADGLIHIFTYESNAIAVLTRFAK